MVQRNENVQQALWSQRLLLGLLLAGVQLALCTAAWADDEADFRNKPSAALAEKIARAALARDQVAKAMNWAERVPQAAGATAAQLAWLNKMRTDLRWRLNDAGVAPVQIRVTPASADLLIDGAHVPFHTGMHTLWLPEGVHQLEAIAVDFVTVTQSIGARRGEREVYVVEMEPSRPPELIVHMTPDGDVVVNGALLGSSTKIRFVVSSGRHLVELRAKGYIQWTQEITLKTGDVKHLDVQLKAIVPPIDPALARRAHQIDRPLLPSEVAEQTLRTIARPDVAGSGLDRELGARANVDAASPEAQRKARETATAKVGSSAPKPDEAAAQAAPAATAEPKQEAKASGERREEAARPAPAAAARSEPEERVSERPSAPSPGLSRATKGWIYGGAGVAALGAGLVLAYLGAKDAETANQLPRGSNTYSDDYQAAAGKTYLGYGAAGLGAVGIGVGSYYLFGSGGLSRKGKGWVVTTLGTLTAAAGAWLVLDAVALGKATDQDLSPSNPEYTRRFDLAVRNRWIGIGVGGAGAALVGTGIALLATAPSASSVRAEPAENSPRPALAWQVHPWVGGNATGASLAVGW